MTILRGFALLCGFSLLSTACLGQDKPQSVNLEQAIEMALHKAPEIMKANALNKAAAASVNQSASWSNPHLAIEAENIGGSGGYTGYDSAETTASITQLVEIGGKRSAKRLIAERDRVLSQLDQKNEALIITRKVKLSFAEASAAQERLKLASQQSDMANDILEGVRRRVDAAADPLYQKNKAEIARASSELAMKKAERERKTALQILGTLMNSEVTQIDTGAFYQLTEPAEAFPIEPDLIIAREDLEVQKSKAMYVLERANAVPDPTFSAGVRNFKEDDENAFIVGVSFPIPVLNLNRGNIQRAGYEIAARDAERQQIIRDTRMEIMERQKRLFDAYQDAITLKKTILPQAESALKDARRGYNAGSFAYLDVLDAQRTLFENKEAYLNALLEYQINQAEVEYLTAPATSPEIK